MTLTPSLIEQLADKVAAMMAKRTKRLNVAVPYGGAAEALVTAMRARGFKAEADNALVGATLKATAVVIVSHKRRRP